VTTDVERDILKIAVVNRYFDAPVAVSFVKNFGLRRGAIASSVAHDSHNIIVVGVDDKSICEAVNILMQVKGGVIAVADNTATLLELPIAGIMSGEDGYIIAKKYEEIDAVAKQMGSTLAAPFMSLSFMGLLVIPNLKMSDFGLFDGVHFELVSTFS
jgi:adenine deaminase